MDGSSDTIDETRGSERGFAAAQRARLSRARLHLTRSPLAHLPLGSVELDRIRPLPVEPWFPAVTATPSFAEDFYLGRYRLAGIPRERSYPPFETGSDDFEGEPRPWGEALHGFGWLRPLADEATPLARANAQAFTQDWIDGLGLALAHPAWEPVTAARRLDAWLTHHAWLVRDASGDFAQILTRSVLRHVRALRWMAGGLTGTARVEVGAVLALAHAALATRPRGLAHVEAMLGGGEPDSLARLAPGPREAMRLLCLLRRTASARDRVPPFLEGAIAALSRRCARLVHADGRMAAFDGAGHLDPKLVAAAIGDTDAGEDGEAAQGSARRIAGAGDALAIVDGGGPFASAGAFEMSVAAGRIVVSCNVPERDGPLREALAGAAAHSTLDAPGEPLVERPLARDGGTLRLTTRHGTLRHTRALAFEAEGLTGIETIEASDEIDAGLRFHLHPHVTALGEGRHAVALTLAGPSGRTERWAFHCLDAPIALEETMIFAESAADYATGIGRPSTQIVVKWPSGVSEIRWMFVRH